MAIIENTDTYTIAGMTCEHCERSIREEVEAIDGVTQATADHVTGTLVVVGDATAVAVKAAVEEAGYEVVA